MRKERLNEIWGVFFLLVGLFTLASFIFFHPGDLPFYTSHPASPVQNVTGVIGAYLAFGLRITFGLSALLIPALFLLWSACFFLQRVPEKKLFKFVGLGIALFSTSTLVALSVSAKMRFEEGGAVGYLAASHLLRYFGNVGSTILAGSCLLLSLLLATDFLIYPLVQDFISNLAETTKHFLETCAAFREWLIERTQGFRPAQPKSEKVAKRPTPNELRIPALPEIPLKVKQYRPDLPEPFEKSSESEDLRKSERPEKSEGQIKETVKLRAEKEILRQPAPSAEEPKFEGVIGSRSAQEDLYVFPPVDLLKRPVKGVAQGDNLQQNSKLLEETLAEFGIEVKVVEVEQGPVITRYELLPAPGVKVNSIAALSDDIALALKAASVRLIIPIPGKSAVGVEVPNSIASMVSLRELIESQTFRNKKYVLPLALGKDTSGKPLIADLTSMPHILIAGTTGSGKTVCVNSIVTGLLYACSPAYLKFVMVDPKMVELAVYNKIPHMLSPVVTDVRKAAHTLNWVVTEMENRYKLFATVGVRNIQAFNARPLSEEALKQMTETKSDNVVPARLPYIVLVIDELADLMMASGKEVEASICRIAQMARAVGMHLIVATQRPSVDVITGLIKANIPARVAYAVTSGIDSRTILDAIGAEDLLGQGDMLFVSGQMSKPIRIQGVYVSSREIEKVTNRVKLTLEPEYDESITSLEVARQNVQGLPPSRGSGGNDPLYEKALGVIVEARKASASLLQRRMEIGYARAARILDEMESNGVIGPVRGAKPREIYVNKEAE